VEQEIKLDLIPFEYEKSANSSHAIDAINLNAENTHIKAFSDFC
jgi:hypothetical protein